MEILSCINKFTFLSCSFISAIDSIIVFYSFVIDTVKFVNEVPYIYIDRYISPWYDLFNVTW